MTNLTPVQHRIGTQNAKPAHEHDCKSCVFLGCAIDNHHGDKTIDLYVCDKQPMSMGRTFIQRYSSDGADYGSFPLSHLRQLHAEDFLATWTMGRYGLAMNLKVALDILGDAYVPHTWVKK